MISSMSQGNRWCRVSSKLSLSTRFVCAWTSFSTNIWWSLFLLLEWIHPSIDQQWSHADAEYYPSPRHQNDTTYTMLSVTIDTVIHNRMWYTYWNTFEPRESTKREYCDFHLLKFFVDWLGVDHALARCYTGSISSFAVFFGLNPPGNSLIIRKWIGNRTESGQGFLMCSHCLNALSGLRKCFLKEIFIPRHMLNTHSSHFVALHLNFLFATTYVF